MLALEMFMNGSIPYISNIAFDDVAKVHGGSKDLLSIEKDFDCELINKKINRVIDNYNLLYKKVLAEYFNPTIPFIPVSELARKYNISHKNLRREVDKAQRLLKRDKLIKDYLNRN